MRPTQFDIVVWSFILGLNSRAFALKQILWPPRQDESDEHLWREDLRPGEGLRMA